MLPNRKITSILKGIKKVKDIYAKRGFRVTLGMMDNEFEHLRADFVNLGLELNVVANDEHVPEVERYVRTIKERTRSVYNVLPYKRMPARMLVEMVKASVFWLNTFPSSDGVSDTMSPRLLIVGFNVDYAKHCKLEFGTYAQVHEDHDNSMATRTTGAIALRPTGNAQGGYYFMSLTTGRRLNRNHWMELPMPQDVINRVHPLARRSNANKSLLFTDRHGGPINNSGDDEDDNKHYTEDNNDDDDDDDFVPGVDQDDDNDDRDPDNDALNGLDGDDDDNLDNNDNDNNVNNDDIPLAGVDDGDDPDIAGVTDDADTPANNEDTK